MMCCDFLQGVSTLSVHCVSTLVDSKLRFDTLFQITTSFFMMRCGTTLFRTFISFHVKELQDDEANKKMKTLHKKTKKHALGTG